MIEGLSMVGTEPSVPLNGASAMPKSSPFAATDNPADVHTDGSGHSLNVSGPSTPVHETSLNQPAESNADNVFQPYAIEEPDDEAESAHLKRDLPCLPDYFECWQRELVDSMHDLGSRPNKAVAAAAKPHQNPRRGQKRKPVNSTGALHNSQFHRSKSKTRLEETPLHVPGLGSKRRRRRSKLPGDVAGNGGPVSLQHFRETHSDGSSSSDPLSAGASSTDTVDETAVADEMDID